MGLEFESEWWPTLTWMVRTFDLGGENGAFDPDGGENGSLSSIDARGSLLMIFMQTYGLTPINPWRWGWDA